MTIKSFWYISAPYNDKNVFKTSKNEKLNELMYTLCTPYMKWTGLLEHTVFIFVLQYSRTENSLKKTISIKLKIEIDNHKIMKSFLIL